MRDCDAAPNFEPDVCRVGVPGGTEGNVVYLLIAPYLSMPPTIPLRMCGFWQYPLREAIPDILPIGQASRRLVVIAIEGSDKRRFFAVLHMGAVNSPADAVRAAIVAEHRSGK